VIVCYWILIITGWLANLFQCRTALPVKPFFPAHNRITSDDGAALPESDCETGTGFFRGRKKPQWVIDNIIYLKAVHPLFGCRKIAELFDRLYATKYNMTVSKSYVYATLLNYRYEIQVVRRMVRHRRPKALKRNICWGVDLTTVTNRQGNLLPVFVMVDYGSRRCVCLQHITSKHSVVLVWILFKTIVQCGKPKSIKTDNEAVFTSLMFKSALKLAGIKHQTTHIASPWENGRVERLIGTFKEKIRQLAISDHQHLISLLPQFQFWYDQVRTHSYLDGKTPMEAWNNVDVFRSGYKRAYWFEDWDGLLTGYYLQT
jgi:putative transposase